LPPNFTNRRFVRERDDTNARGGLVKVKRKSSKETRKETRRRNQVQESGRKKQETKCKFFRKKKASKKTYLAYTRGCHISETTAKQ
jgi:hypothetical protein